MPPDETPSTFVGRESQVATLVDVVRRAHGGQGSTTFITGELGSGKQTLLDELRLRVQHDDALAATRFARGVCGRDHEGENAYEPFVGLLLDLLDTDRGSKTASAILKALKDTAPDWLGMVPIAGPAITAGVKTAIRAHEIYASDAAEERARRTQSRHLQFIAALDARLEKAPAVVLEISQGQWMDGPSAGLLDRVAQTRHCSARHRPWRLRPRGGDAPLGMGRVRGSVAGATRNGGPPVPDRMPSASRRRGCTAGRGVAAHPRPDRRRGGIRPHEQLVGARSLLAELQLRRGHPREARDSSAAALGLLEEAGSLAIVRNEEILWRHARCLVANGEAGAEQYYARAFHRRSQGSLGAERAARIDAMPLARALGVAVSDAPG